MKILFLVPYPLDSAPSQRFRFEQYFKYLEEKGITYKVQSFLDEKAWKVLYRKGGKWKKFWGVIRGFLRRDWQMLNLFGYNLVFIHREAAPIGPPLYEWWIAKVLKKKIIYDFDDAIWLPNTSDGNSIVSGMKWHCKVGDNCSLAWKVSAGNEYLAEYARRNVVDQEKVVVMPTTIDIGYHKSEIPERVRDDELVIGWTGTHSTAAYLENLVPVVDTLSKKYDIKFLVISNKQPSRQSAVGSWSPE